MSLRDCTLIIDRRYFLRLILCASALLLFIGSCATVETNRNVDGPYIVSTYPSPGDFHISRYTDINIRFSEAMDASTETGFEILSRGMKIDGTKKWTDSFTTLVFRPYKPLDANGMYQCVMRDGRSRDDKALAGVPYIWMFTTGN